MSVSVEVFINNNGPWFSSNEELETSILDYMLFYVYVRSKNYEKLQYKNLINLLDTLIE